MIVRPTAAGSGVRLERNLLENFAIQVERFVEQMKDFSERNWESPLLSMSKGA